MSTDGKTLIGKRIKELRESQGYTPRDIARNLKINETELRKIEEGNFSLELSQVLARILTILEGAVHNRWTKHKDQLYQR